MANNKHLHKIRCYLLAYTLSLSLSLSGKIVRRSASQTPYVRHKHTDKVSKDTAQFASQSVSFFCQQPKHQNSTAMQLRQPDKTVMISSKNLKIFKFLMKKAFTRVPT